MIYKIFNRFELTFFNESLFCKMALRTKICFFYRSGLSLRFE